MINAVKEITNSNIKRAEPKGPITSSGKENPTTTQINSISKRIAVKLGDILSFNGVSVDSFKLEGIVEDYLSNGLRIKSVV